MLSIVCNHPKFSPRIAFLVKPAENHSVTLSYNRAFRAPSVINNALQTNLVSPVDLSALAPLLPPGLQPAVAQPFPLVVAGVGSDVPIGGMSQDELTEESLTAYERDALATHAAKQAGECRHGAELADRTRRRWAHSV